MHHPVSCLCKECLDSDHVRILPAHTKGVCCCASCIAARVRERIAAGAVRREENLRAYYAGRYTRKAPATQRSVAPTAPAVTR